MISFTVNKRNILGFCNSIKLIALPIHLECARNHLENVTDIMSLEVLKAAQQPIDANEQVNLL
jgi:hypothetical protein